MDHPYQAFVERFAQLLAEGRSLPLGGFPAPPAAPLRPDAPVTLVFSPHPDDEALVGALPLRLRREAGHRVVVAAVTLGSDPGRRAGRLEEVRGAADFLGFEVALLGEGGLTGVTPTAQADQPDAWSAAVAQARALLQRHRPALVLAPHDRDGHPTHEGTGLLALDALRGLGPDHRCRVALTEFWQPLAAPNLMVESAAGEVADLVAAVSFHRGEVRRAPYHLLLPAWMADNVRRGSERVGQAGGAFAPFRFATLYRLCDWNGRDLRPLANRWLGAGEPPGDLAVTPLPG